MNISIFNKIIILLSLMSIFGSCKNYKDTFIDSYNDEVLYMDELDCSLFKYGFTKTQYKHYNPKKCFKIKFNFTDNEFDELKYIYKRVSQLSKKELKLNPNFYVSEVENNSKQLLVSNKYGFYKVVGKKFAPFFYFLRTESGLYFYNCNNKITLIEELNKSRSIDNILKNKIILFIEESCNTENGLKWYAGARFY